MMMILTTLSEQTGKTHARVYWRVGAKRQGIIDVVLELASDDVALMCELACVKHLLFEKKVFGRQAPVSGAGYELIVSRGAIKKLALGVSDKKFAVKAASFLTGRMKGVAIRVSQETGTLPSEEEFEPEHLFIPADKDWDSHELVETPALGRIQITRHAVEQYAERITSGSPKRPWASLVNRLLNTEMEQLTLPQKVQAHKIRKYGQLDEIWSHPTSNFQFVVCRRDDGVGVLVTAVVRPES